MEVIGSNLNLHCNIETGGVMFTMHIQGPTENPDGF